MSGAFLVRTGSAPHATRRGVTVRWAEPAFDGLELPAPVVAEAPAQLDLFGEVAEVAEAPATLF